MQQSESVSEIPLTKGYTAIVDAADLPVLMEYKWYAFTPHKCRTVYACTHKKGSRGGSLFMHRLLMGEPQKQIDHKDGNGLNNRRGNLREASQGQQNANTPVRRTSSSGFKGVQKRGVHFFAAKIQHNGKQIYLGSRPTAAEAARLYDAAAPRFHGEFAYLNFPPVGAA